MRVTNRVLPPAPASEPAPVDDPPDEDTRLFAPEGSAEGCASGDCLPQEPAAPPAHAAAPAAAAPEGAAERWRSAVDAVRAAFPRHGKSLSFARLISLGGGEVRVSFGQAHSFHRATVFGTARADVEKILALALAAPHRLVEETSQQAWAAAPRSIAELEADDRATRERNIDGRARDSHEVRSILRLLGGSIEHIQVLDPPAPEEPALPPADDES